MKKNVLAFMLIFACLWFVGCPNPTITDEPKKEPTINIPLESVETTGTVTTPVKDGDTTTLVCEDENGGKYTFTQSATENNWNYSVENEILFSGTFEGDIDSEDNLSDLELTVNQAADSQGNLKETVEDITFDFSISEEGFTATIPSVEIAIPDVKDTTASTEKTKALLDEAVDLLLDGDIDSGITKIKKAYAGQQNDETKMYYALAELASISVDSSVSTLLRENFGIEDYPSTMNALLSTEWLETESVPVGRSVSVEEESANGDLNTFETAEDVALQILFNVIDCNKTGFNKLIDNILAVFGKKFESAKTLAASVSNASVEIPAKLFEALDLEEIFGESSAKIGKAELNILIASMEVLQGTFQWIASYDLSVNMESIGDLIVSDLENVEEDFNVTEFYKNLISENTLTIRNENSMKDSKQSFLDAINMLVASYDYLISEESEYPKTAVDALKENGEPIKTEVLKLRDAIRTGSVYTIPQEDNTNTFGIDFGKFFRAGYFTNLADRDSDGTLKLYTHTAKDCEQLEEEHLAIKVNYKLIKDLLPGCFKDEDLPDVDYICFYGEESVEPENPVDPEEPENTETTEETKALLNEAVDLLMEGDVDGGIAKIKTAYKGQQNDETKMYYALAELASISVDESVATLLEENFGIVNYPATMNALLNGEWLKEYENTEYRQVLEIMEGGAGCYRVRVSGYEDFDSEIFAEAEIYEGQWIDSWTPLSGVYLDENGPYLVHMWDLQDMVSDEELDAARKYCYDYTDEYIEITTGSIFAPEFAPVEGLDSVTTSTQLSMQIMANLLDCNPDGLNSGIDNVLAVFGDKFETAKSLAASMSNASVEVPADLFDALELEDVLGKSTLKVGKAELNLLIASMEILQGTFQWISSYDWYINIKDFEYTFVDDDLYFPMEEPLTLFRNVIDERTLTVRNAKAMTDSKESFIDAIDMVINSYDYIIGDTSEYPQAAREQIEEYGEIIKEALEGVKTAIETEKVFYVPQEDPFETGTWNCSEESAMFGIDFGKFFTPGYFSDLIEKEADGSMKLSLYIRWYNVDSDENTSEFFEISSNIDSLEELETFAQEKFEELGISEDNGDLYFSVINKLNYQKLSDMLPKIELLEGDCYMFLFGKTISD